MYETRERTNIQEKYGWGEKHLMAQWLRQASQDMTCAVHDLEVMGLIPGQVQVGEHSVLIHSCTKINIHYSLLCHHLD